MVEGNIKETGGGRMVGVQSGRGDVRWGGGEGVGLMRSHLCP